MGGFLFGAGFVIIILILDRIFKAGILDSCIKMVDNIIDMF